MAQLAAINQKPMLVKGWKIDHLTSPTRWNPLTTISGFIPSYTHLQPWLDRVCWGYNYLITRGAPCCMTPKPHPQHLPPGNNRCIQPMAHLRCGRRLPKASVLGELVKRPRVFMGMDTEKPRWLNFLLENEDLEFW